MRRILLTGTYAAYLLVAALGYYEWTAKSPDLIGLRLPGWRATRDAERATRWEEPTGWQILDRTLHEAREALHFYGLSR